MTQTNHRRGIIGSTLTGVTVIGLLIVLAGCSLFVRQQALGERLRAQLQETPAAAPAGPQATSTAMPAAAASLPAPTASPTTAPAVSALPASPTPAATATVTPTLAAAAVVALEAPVRIVIPDLKLDAPVVEMGWQIINTATGAQSDWVIPKNAAGHHINSAALNEAGNVVISGHNNIEGKVFEAVSLAWDDRSRARVDDFTDSSESLKGRKIQLYNAAGKSFDYTITDFLRLKDAGVSQEQQLKNARYMDPTDERRLTLVTCWPPWSNTHRLIVIAKPAQP